MQNDKEFALINSQINNILIGQALTMNSQTAYFSTIQDLFCQILAKITDGNIDDIRLESSKLLHEHLKVCFEQGKQKTADIDSFMKLVELLKNNSAN